MAQKDNSIREIRNQKAYQDYVIGDRIEAGVELLGTEVKAIRKGEAQLNGAFVRVKRGEAFLYNAHVKEYAFGNLNNHEPLRTRKLLLSKKEIVRLQYAMEAQGYTVVPLKMYFKGALVKVEIGLGKGKKQHDKREDIKRKEANQEAAQVMKRMKRGL